MLYTPKKVPLNWYRYDSRFSLELLKEYIGDVEQQVNATIESFRKEKETRVLEDVSAEGFSRAVEMYRGLDDETWDLKEIFEELFPNLQRRGALITLYSFLENKLDELCELFIQVEKIKISLNDLRGAGVDRSVLFLTRIMGLQIDQSTTVWQEIKNIQKVRNLIVHNDAKLIDRSGNQIADVTKYVTTSPYLSGNDEIEILDGYLPHILETFDLQFQDIDKLIAARGGT